MKFGTEGFRTLTENWFEYDGAGKVASLRGGDNFRQFDLL